MVTSPLLLTVAHRGGRVHGAFAGQIKIHLAAAMHKTARLCEPRFR